MQGIEIRDSEQDVLTFDLKDILRVIGHPAIESEWICSYVDYSGNIDNSLERLLDWGESDPISGELLFKLASEIIQTIDGNFIGYKQNEQTPWIVIKAIDSSLWEVFSTSFEVLKNIEASFNDVSDAQYEEDEEGFYR